MKKNSSRDVDNPGKKPSGASSPLQINLEDASRLVGGIVEKGFSDQPMPPSSAPHPTVLPFPLARHRSHGPHWNPMPDYSSRGSDNGHEEEDEEQEDLTGYIPISVFANPVQRKHKKGLDFSHWREVTKRDFNSVQHKDGEKHLAESKEQTTIRKLTDTSGKLTKPSFPENDNELCEMSHNAPAIEQKDSKDALNSDNNIQLEASIAEIKKETMMEMDSNLFEVSGDKMEEDTDLQNNLVSSIASDSIPDSSLTEEGYTSLESQIDAENRARLGRMSADEIAEAQVEIMSKMKPELIQALRKRGEQKLNRQKSSYSDMSISGEDDKQKSRENQLIASAPLNSGSSGNMIKADAKDRQEGNGVPEPRPKSSSLWDSWTKRVEGVRELRFSIDGNVVEIGYSEVLGIGNASGQSGYNVDNVSERDFLRTDGDPGAAGYSIKEAVALCRSVVPGQRALALHLIASVLDKALHNIQQTPVGYTLNYAGTGRSLDWEAIWAFALGPEPELALSLRICLDDNHNSVVLTCAKAIQSLLCCDINGCFFDLSENTATGWKDLFTAPVFRSRPEMDVGFLHGGFWKYNTKPANIVPFRDGFAGEETEGEQTIKDDIVVAGQDVAAGLVRMGILQRILYLLETDPSGVLEESLISILVAFARHSPTCASAIMTCPRLVQTVVNRFITIDQMEINPSKIRSVTLLKVLARAEKTNCTDFMSSGVFQKMMWHLYRPAFSIEQWAKSGRDACKLSSALLVEQLRFWKVCILHGYGISYFADLFPALCTWLNAPELDKLLERNVIDLYATITKEVYLVLGSLSKRLPNFYLNMDKVQEAIDGDTESWCWSYVGPIIDLSLEWTKLDNIPCLSKTRDWQYDDKESSDMQVPTMNSLLWLISSVFQMLSGVLEAVIPEDNVTVGSEGVPWLPDFVPRIGLAIIKNNFFSFSEVKDTECDFNLTGGSSFLKSMLYLRQNSREVTSIASVCCLQGLVKVILSVDKLIQLANPEVCELSSQSHHLSRDERVLANGILPSALVELEYLLATFMKLVNSEWQYVQSAEMFGRGGPTPGVGVGWGASRGGFFSMGVLLSQIDARFLGYLLQIFQIVSPKDSFTVKERSFLPRINSTLEACLIAGPRERFLVSKLFDMLFQVPVLRYLDSVISQFHHLQALTPFGWKYEEEEYMQFSAVLASHYKHRWLSVKKNIKVGAESSQSSRGATRKVLPSLETIHEEEDFADLINQGKMLLVQEWAHQRLPLPTHWFLSPISIVLHGKRSDRPTASNKSASLEVINAALFFILGIEAMSAFLTSECFVRSVSVVWKLHALSVMLLDGMAILEDEKSRNVYETLQNIYGQYVEESKRPEKRENISLDFLNFRSEVHESYSIFIETLVEQFAAESYGDLVFGRQVAIYLHRRVESPVRLTMWNTLSNARALELLPPLERCIAEADGYLEPVEDDESMLEAYVKSWVSDALDRAAARGSATFKLALHHLSTFIFKNCLGGRLSLRNKIVKSLLRDYSRKQYHKDMMLNLIQYKSATGSKSNLEEACSLQIGEIEKRLCLLRDVCEGNSSLLSQVEKLEASIRQECQQRR